MQNITSVMNYHPIIYHKDHPQCAGYQRDHHQTLMLSTSSRRCRRGKQALAWSRNFYQLLQHLRHLRRSSKVKHLTKAKILENLKKKFIGLGGGRHGVVRKRRGGRSSVSSSHIGRARQSHCGVVATQTRESTRIM